MLRNFLIFLALANGTTDPAPENEIAQIPMRYSPIRSAYINSLRQKIDVLQQKNADLTRKLLIMQAYKKKADILQLRLDDLEQTLSDLNRQNKDLEAQLKEDETQITLLSKAQESSFAEMKRCNELVRQAREQRRLFDQDQQQNKQELQESKNKANKLNEDLQKALSSLSKCEQQLRESQEKIVQLQKFQKTSEEVGWLNEQIQAKNKKIAELNQKIGELNQQNYSLGLSRNVSNQQLQEKAKHLETSKKARQQTLNEAKELETRLQAIIDDKTATINTWRKEYDLLKSQFDKAFSLNQELRQQITQLEAECKKR